MRITCLRKKIWIWDGAGQLIVTNTCAKCGPIFKGLNSGSKTKSFNVFTQGMCKLVRIAIGDSIGLEEVSWVIASVPFFL